MPDRPDPLTDALARFTPAARLDRDEMLFQAGRASARAGRLWKGVAALLLATNVATLTMWFSTRPRQVVVIETQPAPIPAEPVEPQPTEAESQAPSWTVTARRSGELPPRSEGTDARLIESKPLTIRSGLTSPFDI
jgi:hypothetical protein